MLAVRADNKSPQSYFLELSADAIIPLGASDNNQYHIARDHS